MGATPSAPQEAASGTVEPWQKTAPYSCVAPRGVKWRLPFRVLCLSFLLFLLPVVVVAVCVVLTKFLLCPGTSINGTKRCEDVEQEASLESEG